MVSSKATTCLKRNLAACDQCHNLKLKCVFLTHDCSRCQRLGVRCTSHREKQKRGRKPKNDEALQGVVSKKISESSEDLCYPILDCLSPFGIYWGKPVTSSIDQICSPSQASRILEHFFASPNQEFHARILRRRHVLDIQSPRATSPALLLSVLCVACYMPKTDNSSVLPDISSSGLVTIRRSLLSQSLKLLRPIMMGDVDPTFDDAITFFMISTVGASENDTHIRLPHWLTFMKYSLRKLHLYAEAEGISQEEREERRRMWWSGYTIDRHVALSFNLRPETTDLECAGLQRPCPDEVWESDISLEEYFQSQSATSVRGIVYSVLTLDLYGILLPLSSITGDILEYHFLRHHSTFSSHRPFMTDIRNNIKQNLQLWDRTLRDLLSRHENKNLLHAVPKIVLYGRHIYHCLHILLFGTMDFISMHHDLAWQSSPDFVLAGEHALSCASIAGEILTTDPHLQYMYRYFGTYLLQSSFIFLILAQKLGAKADELILQNCAINLRVLNVFVKVVDVEYQRTFARVMREVLARRIEEDGEGAGDKELDPKLLQYRWVAGYNGLWNEDMALAARSHESHGKNSS